jgi:hypothetical protein
MPFTEEQAPFFFGRDAEREIVTANLMAARLTLFYGPSGVGKSSVINAGVAYHLRQLAREALDAGAHPQFVIVLFREWRDDPLAMLERAIERELGVPASGPTFGDRLQRWAEHIDGELLLVLDQFEEYFMYHPGETRDGTFAVEFARAVNRRDLRASFLVSMREDSIAKLDFFKGQIPNLFDNYLRIDRLDRDKARDAIVEPIHEFNRLMAPPGVRFAIEPALVDAVLDQVKANRLPDEHTGLGRVGAENHDDLRVETPHLQLVMTRLWQEERAAGSATLRLATLRRLGGASEIVKRHVDSALDALSPVERDAAARIFQYLVTPAGTKIALGVDDLYPNAGMSAEDLRALLLRLSAGDARILTSVAPAPDQSARERFQIFHDVLAEKVLEWRRRYVAAAEQRAAEAVADEQRRRAEKEARVASRLRALLALVALLAAAAIGLAAFAWRQTQVAESQRQSAEQLKIVADRGAADAEVANRSAEQRRLELLAGNAARSALEQENRNLQLAKAAVEARLAGRLEQASRLETEAAVAANRATVERANSARLLEAARQEQAAADAALARSQQIEQQLRGSAAAAPSAPPPAAVPDEPVGGVAPAPAPATPEPSPTSPKMPAPEEPPVAMPPPGAAPTVAPAPAAPGAATAAVPVSGDYREIYRKAIDAKNRRRWDDAARLFQQALALRGTDTGERISISGFGNIEPYLPHYYLGVALMNLGDCDRALENWDLSEKDGAIQKTGLYASLKQNRQKCRQ